MANILGIVGLVVAAFALLWSILALALESWTVLDTNAVDAGYGIWTYTFEVSGRETSGDILDVLNADREDAAKAVQAMVVLGFICIFVAIVVVVLLLFLMKDKKILGFIAGGVAILGGLFHMIGMAVYVGELMEDSPDGTDYGAGFAFNILAWLFAWIAGGIIIFAAIKGGGGVGSN